MSLHVRCPHCQNPIELIDIPSNGVLCPSCGSSFCPQQGSTAPQTREVGPGSVGRFVLQQTLGMGSFGTVYQARDPDLDRVVALKVPRSGNLGGSEGTERFLREARNVAQLRHPGIIPVYEVGQQGGTPYLVSEFVPGVTLADWLTAHHATPGQAAELIAQLADTLDYAHRSGVVHRDIKPSNIMLELAGPSGGEGATPMGTPRLMDFGLAKRDAGEITMTAEGQVLGTPAYMSPEQARGEGHQVDGRSDIYSLGVILYELLTGKLPFKGSSRMLLHQVLYDDPRPPTRLERDLPRDLETICLKAMAKEPARRYASAGELAADLRRYLDGRSIEARPIGRVERAWRWCRRNPVPASLIALVVLLLVVGAVGAHLVMDHFRQLAERADTAQRQADEALERERQARAEVEAARKEMKARAVRNILAEERRQAEEAPHPPETTRPVPTPPPTRPMELVRTVPEPAPPAPAEPTPKGVPTPEQLKERDRLGEEVARLHQQGKLAEAIAAQEKKLDLERRLRGAAHPDLAASLDELAELQEERGDYAAARKARAEALAIKEKLLDKKNWQVGDARRALNRVERLAALDPAQARKAQEANRLDRQADSLCVQGKPVEGENCARQCLRLISEVYGEADPARADALLHLGLLLQATGRLVEASDCFQQALTIYRQSLGEDHPRTATALLSLGRLLRSQGKYDQAKTDLEQALAIDRRVLGDAHPDVATVLEVLGACHIAGREHERARQCCAEALAIRRKTTPGDDSRIAGDLNNLGYALYLTGDLPKAVSTYEQALAMNRRLYPAAKFPKGHPDLARSLTNLGLLFQEKHDLVQAEGDLRQALTMREALYPSDKYPRGHAEVALSLANLAGVYRAEGKYAAAEPLLRKALQTMVQVLGSDHPQTITARSNLAGLYFDLGEYDRAEPLYRQVLERRKKVLGENHPDYASSLNDLAALYFAMGKPDQARPLYQQARKIRGADKPATPNR